MANAGLQPGDVVAQKYRIEGVLGHGGMGMVYATVHLLTGKRLALKCLLPSEKDPAGQAERFLREARAAGRIHHRHVIDVFDVGRDGDVLYMVMPLLEGKPLSHLIHSPGLTLSDVLTILLRAMEGVVAAHHQGIVHRDIKPANLFVCRGVSGRLDDPRVLDFGISKLEDERETSLTRSGAAMGTPHYMAIEQLTGQRDLDQRVDVYAMGVILYEALAARLPHTAENVAALALRVMHHAPLHLGTVRPDLPRGFADVVMRAIARDRGDRFPTMQALIEAIHPFVLAGAAIPVVLRPRPAMSPDGALQPTEPYVSGSSEPPSPSRSSTPGDSSRPARRARSVALLGVALAFLALGGSKLMSNSDAPPKQDEPPAAKSPSDGSAAASAAAKSSTLPASQAPPSQPTPSLDGGTDNRGGPLDVRSPEAPQPRRSPPVVPRTRARTTPDARTGRQTLPEQPAVSSVPDAGSLPPLQAGELLEDEF